MAGREGGAARDLAHAALEVDVAGRVAALADEAADDRVGGRACDCLEDGSNAS